MVHKNGVRFFHVSHLAVECSISSNGKSSSSTINGSNQSMSSNTGSSRNTGSSNSTINMLEVPLL